MLVPHDAPDIRRADQARRDFVANVSHELKTPLTAIRGFAETLVGELSHVHDPDSPRVLAAQADLATAAARATAGAPRMVTAPRRTIARGHPWATAYGGRVPTLLLSPRVAANAATNGAAEPPPSLDSK